MALLHDKKNCIGCAACQQACQDYHGLPTGVKLMAITEREMLGRGNPVVFYEMKTCRQCVQSACAAACPAQAIWRGEDGVVRVRMELCRGCGACAEACPAGAVVLVYDASGSRALKCMECVGRSGGPVCVAACPLSCIRIAAGEKVL